TCIRGPTAALPNVATSGRRHRASAPLFPMTWKGPMNRGRIRKQFRITTLSLALGACFASGVQAQSNTTGTVFGQAAEGDRITVTHVGTGLERSVSVGASGDFRVGALPPGQYRITRTSASGQTCTREVV